MHTRQYSDYHVFCNSNFLFMKTPILVLGIVSCSIITACTGNAEQPKEVTALKPPLIHKAEWVLGSWRQTTDEGYTIEVWTRQSDTDYAGISYTVHHGTDTVSAETIRLVQRDTTLYYIPTVKDQNDAKPVAFKLSSITDQQMIFDNPGHDFPQRITYRSITKDSLYAEISGVLNGSQQVVPFPMTRVK